MDSKEGLLYFLLVCNVMHAKVNDLVGICKVMMLWVDRTRSVELICLLCVAFAMMHVAFLSMGLASAPSFNGLVLSDVGL